MAKLKSILFDLDGTLCDCTELHYESLNVALKKTCNYTITKEDHLFNYNGIPTKKKLEKLNKLNIVPEHLNNEIWDLKQKNTIKLIKKLLHKEDEKIKLLSYLKNKNYKIACVTNSINKTAKLILKKTGQLQYMDLVISNDMILNPKPHPEGWITAMVKFKSLPNQTLIVEDSPVGLKSAELSGGKIWKINHSNDINLENFLALNLEEND